MKKAIVLGGSNGIGLAIALKLIEQEYNVIIIDKCKPEKEYLENKQIVYKKCDLRNYDSEMFENLAKDKEIELLMITAGYGRIAKFADMNISEIKNQLQVNTISIIEIIKIFYNRILSKDKFYTGIMASIAGRISSPLFSTYSASKGALVKFIEAVNIELEKNKTNNRILEVSPGSIKGTNFYGKANDLQAIYGLANEIINKLINSETLFIPEYEKVYKRVIHEYQSDSRKFGIESYNYKIAQNRDTNKKSFVVGYMSGTFDLFHMGHLNIIKKAKEECDYLIVGVHFDASHKGKKTFIPLEERKAIVETCKYVDKVVNATKEDSDAWNLYKFDKLFVGSDYKGTDRFKKYEEFFKNRNVDIMYFPYTQSTSSTQIRNLIENHII